MPDYGGDWLKYSNRGDPFAFPAKLKNALVDMVLEGNRADPLAGLPDHDLDVDDPEGLVYIKNTTGAALLPMQVVGLDALIIPMNTVTTPFNRRPNFVGVVPTVAGYLGTFAVTRSPIANNGVGLAFASGICVAQVNITNAGDDYCDVKNNDVTQLQSSSAGSAQILWAPSGTGMKACMIRIGVPPPIRFVKLTTGTLVQATVSTPATCTYTLKDSNGNTIATGIDPATSPGQARPVAFLTAATIGIATFYQGAWILLWTNEVFPTETGCT